MNFIILDLVYRYIRVILHQNVNLPQKIHLNTYRYCIEDNIPVKPIQNHRFIQYLLGDEGAAGAQGAVEDDDRPVAAGAGPAGQSAGRRRVRRPAPGRRLLLAVRHAPRGQPHARRRPLPGRRLQLVDGLGRQADDVVVVRRVALQSGALQRGHCRQNGLDGPDPRPIHACPRRQTTGNNNSQKQNSPSSL